MLVYADQLRCEGLSADPDSTRYVAAIETAEQFGKRLYLEAWKHGWRGAERKR